MLRAFVVAAGIICAIASSVAAQTAGASGAPPITAAPSPAGERFVEVGIDQLSSPFTKDTVLKLNAIVGRSKLIIDRFDASIPTIRKAVAAGAAADATPQVKRRANASLGDLDGLAAGASADLADMKRAERQIRASGEKYNEPILAAMVRFVADVDDELRTEHRELSEKIVSPAPPRATIARDH